MRTVEEADYVVYGCILVVGDNNDCRNWCVAKVVVVPVQLRSIGRIASVGRRPALPSTLALGP